MIQEQSPRAFPMFMAGGGEMGARMRAVDWSKNPLGPVEQWPQTLRTCVRIVLTSRQPMFVWWGDQLINLYNDAYKSIVGGKHPGALGAPASVVWPEIWNEIGPRARSTMRGDEGTYDEALLLIMERNGYREETYYTFSYSPVPNDQGGTGGLLCANTDDTRRIVGERQLSLLRELGARTVDARTRDEACLRGVAAIETAGRDLPFAMIYLVEPGREAVYLAGAAGIRPGHWAAPGRVSLSGRAPWPFREALERGTLSVVSGMDGALDPLPTGLWPKAPTSAAIVPIAGSGEAQRRGVLVTGLNPFRLFDDDYRAFLTLVAGQIAASIANAEAYEEEKRRVEALAELDRAKTAFFSNVSHEFRTPLTLIMGPLEDALGSGAGVLSRENLETAYRNSVRLMKLVNVLLDYSRIEAGRAVASYVATDLAALTADLASAFRSAIEAAGLSFHVDLPTLSEPVYVDRDMWEKVVLNLLSNALKFTLEGRISVSLRDAPEHVELVVADTGGGIPAEHVPHVFERFHRAPGSRSRTHEGSGIGLALVHELVRLHGGTVGVESTLGEGSVFTIRVPRGKAHLPAERVGDAVAPAVAKGAAPYVLEAERWLPGGGSLASSSDDPFPTTDSVELYRDTKILLADDNADMREYVSRLLRGRFQVEAVSDGEAALATARRFRPDLVLTDVMMPNLDGFGLLTALKADAATRHIPVVVLSARAGDEARVEGLEAGADDYLVKPFSARELVARVTTHLQIARLRAAAEAERGRLFDVFEQAPVPVAVLVGPELRYELANPPYCEMLGRASLAGKTVREAFPEIGEHGMIWSLESAFQSGKSSRVAELGLPVTRNGATKEVFFDYIVHPLRDRANTVTGVIVVAIDVTEQIRARRRIDALRAAAEKASRAKDEFLSTLSHELRTPLNAIVGWSNLLSAGSVPPHHVRKALETIERNARVQARLIDDMLDLSRIEQGKLVLSVGPLEMMRVVEAAIDAVRPGAEAKGVRLQPVLDSHATIVGDADRLQQVVWNLLSNAIKFTPKGGRVQVQLRREKSHVEVVVADTGQGIDAEFLPYVFDRFRQGDGAFTRKAGGLGLGLAIVRSLVELHGGSVGAESGGSGSGATFTVTLPVAPLQASPPLPLGSDPANEDRASTVECPPELLGLRVLVVDDEPATRDLLKFLLEQCESVVTTVSSAEEALQEFSRQTFDVLVSDVGMPVVDGYTLIRRLRELPPATGGAVPALALTAFARGDDRTQALKAGFDMHLAKPIEPTEFLVVVATLINGHQRRRSDG